MDEELIKKVISFLNSLLVIDRKAIETLLNVKVLCNKQLGEHETVQTYNLGNGDYCVGLLGLLNGLFGLDKWNRGPIIAVFDNCNNLIGFKYNG